MTTQCGQVEVIGGAGAVPAGVSAAGLAGTVPLIGVPDLEDPQITNFFPSVNTAIGRTDFVQFDVTDDTGEFTIVIVLARFTDGTCECVWDGDAFTAFYLAGSSKVAIDCGWRYTVRRAGGWLTTPVSIQVIAIDRACNIGRGTL